jgi:heme oxygenase
MTLKDYTKEKHKIAEQMPFNIKLIEGRLSKEAYVAYLNQMSKVYQSIEDKMSDKLPMELLRADNFLKDIVELTGNDQPNQELNESTDAYVKYLNSITTEDLWAHVYLNYLALLYGGQIIKKYCQGSGAIYDFENKGQLIDYIRVKQTKVSPEEVNNGFDYIIKIYHELDK